MHRVSPCQKAKARSGGDCYNGGVTIAYEVLHLPKSATSGQIKRRFFELAKIYVCPFPPLDLVPRKASDWLIEEDFSASGQANALRQQPQG